MHLGKRVFLTNSTDGLSRVFTTIKQTPDINDLPDNYKSVIEWLRIS